MFTALHYVAARKVPTSSSKIRTKQRNSAPQITLLSAVRSAILKVRERKVKLESYAMISKSETKNSC